MVAVRGKPTGYGSTPAASSASRLAIRTRTCSGMSGLDGDCGPPGSLLGAARPSPAGWFSVTCPRLPGPVGGGHTGFSGHVPLEDEPEPDQGQPRVVGGDEAELVHDQR